MSKSAYIRQIAERKLAEQKRLKIMRLIVGDAYTIAAHEILGMGPGRATAFQEAAEKNLAEIFKIIHDDSKDDQYLDYAFSKIDKAMSAIIGQDYKPCEVRYYE